MAARARGAPPARQGAAAATPAERRGQEHRDQAKLHARDALDVLVESAIARDAEACAVRVAEAAARVVQHDASTAARRLKEKNAGAGVGVGTTVAA